MILQTHDGDSLYCIKTNPPKMNGELAYNWDNLEAVVDGQKVKMFFAIKNSRSYFYFKIFNDWYKTKIISDLGLDVWNYIETRKLLFRYYNTK